MEPQNQENGDILPCRTKVELDEVCAGFHGPFHGKERVFGTFEGVATMGGDKNPIRLVELG